MIKILPIAGGGLHPDENLAGRSIQLVQFLFPDLPACPGIGECDRFDHHTFVGSTNAARTGLASNVNPTDILDGRFLLRGSRWSSPHRTPAVPSFPVCVISCHRGKRETRPTRASVSSCWIGNQASAVLSCEKPRAVATSLIDPFDPGGRGAVSPGRSLLRCLNRPQAKTSALPLTPV